MMDEFKLHPAINAFFRHSPSSILVLDAFGAIDSLNPACQRLLGQAEEDLIGLPFIDMLDACNQPDAFSAVRELTLGQRPESRRRLCLKRHNRPALWIRFSATNIADNEGFRISVVILEELGQGESAL